MIMRYSIAREFSGSSFYHVNPRLRPGAAWVLRDMGEFHGAYVTRSDARDARSQLITPSCTIWACVDCLFAREGELETVPDREPWALLAGQDVSIGILWAEHECGREKTHSMDTECECDRVNFTWRPCEACGSTLGGERQAYTLWG